MADRRKREIRDIQRRTGWTYTFCRRAVDALGYERVSQVVDDHSLNEAGNKLHELSLVAKKRRATSAEVIRRRPPSAPPHQEQEQ